MSGSCFVCLDPIEKEDENLYSRLCNCSLLVHLGCLLVLISKNQELKCSVCKNDFKLIIKPENLESSPINHISLPHAFFASATFQTLDNACRQGWVKLLLFFWNKTLEENRQYLVLLHPWDDTNLFQRPCPFIVAIAQRRFEFWNLIQSGLRHNSLLLKEIYAKLQWYSSNTFRPHGSFLQNNGFCYALLPIGGMIIHFLVGILAIFFEAYLSVFGILGLFWATTLIFIDYLDRKSGAKSGSLYIQEWFIKIILRVSLSIHLSVCTKLLSEIHRFQ